MDRKNALHKQGDRNEKINCNCEDKNIPGLDLIKGCSVFLFSGIALNHAFYQTIQALGGKILRHLEFEDHYRYKKGDILQIVDQAKAAGAQMVVTTHKDWVKLDPQLQWPIDLAVVGIQITLEDEQGFERFIATWLNE